MAPPALKRFRFRDLNRLWNRELPHRARSAGFSRPRNFCLKFREIVAYNSHFSEFGVPPWHAYAK